MPKSTRANIFSGMTATESDPTSRHYCSIFLQRAMKSMKLHCDGLPSDSDVYLCFIIRKLTECIFTLPLFRRRWGNSDIL